MDISDIDPTLSIQAEFGPSNIHWQEPRMYGEQFVHVMMQLIEDKYRVEGHLFVNEILWRLGIPLRPEGQLLGWWGPSGDRVIWELDSSAPDDLIVINLQPAGFIWDKL